jgi:hypothetical protein
MIEKGVIYRANDGNTDDMFFVEVLGMSEYRQSLSERHGGCPEYVLTQRMNKIDSVFVKDFRFNTAHWDTEYFAINFERVM